MTHDYAALKAELTKAAVAEDPNDEFIELAYNNILVILAALEAAQQVQRLTKALHELQTQAELKRDHLALLTIEEALSAIEEES